MRSVLLSCFFTLISLLLGSSLWFGCSESNFKAGLTEKGPKGVIVFKNTALEEEADAYAVHKPLAVIFLIDKTGSMTPYIQTVKNNVQSFVDTLKEKDFDVKVGFIAYEDKIISEYELTSDTSAFKNAVGNINVLAWQGFDPAEAGLTAIIRASEKFQDSSLKSYLKVMVLISDNLSHNDPRVDDSTVTNRKCSIDTTVDTLNDLSKSIQKQVKLYYSVPSFVNNGSYAGCSVYTDNPETQLNDILSQSFSAVSSSTDKGGSLGWPFVSNSLINTLPNMIDNASKSKAMLCLVDKVKIDFNGKNSVTYESTFEKEYELYKAGKESSLDIKSDKILNLLKNKQKDKNASWVVNAQQSCFDLTDADNNDFSKPVTQKTIEIPYEFK